MHKTTIFIIFIFIIFCHKHHIKWKRTHNTYIAKVQQVATRIYTFQYDYNDHQTLAMLGHCIAAECNTTSGMATVYNRSRM